MILKIGPKGRHVTIPAGYRLKRNPERVVKGDRVLNLYELQWERVDDIDIGEVADFAGDYVITPTTERK